MLKIIYMGIFIFFFNGCKSEEKINTIEQTETHHYKIPSLGGKSIQVYLKQIPQIDKFTTDIIFGDGTKIILKQKRIVRTTWEYFIEIQYQNKSIFKQREIDLPLTRIWLSDLDKDENFEIILFHTAGSGDFGYLDFYEFDKNKFKLKEYALPSMKRGEANFYVIDNYIYQFFPKFCDETDCLNSCFSKATWITEKYEFKENKIVKISTQEKKNPSSFHRNLHYCREIDNDL